MNSKLEFLRSQYGVVMTLEQLAKALSRKPGGLREALDKPREVWAIRMNARKIYVGRRMYFPVEAVASLLDGAFASSEEGINESHD
ncbi:hypothetical protein [Ottowia sp.]|jgi:hypothetical protein|uniref:hypothetical protein n=1 Tax=Ottowia sp. TaxID=1898956 RepID=UPI0025FA6056|nr:hypothetical protein [Ottowia sp.]MBK6612612.1 hypothetical protein [Ottowia sp.]